MRFSFKQFENSKNNKDERAISEIFSGGIVYTISNRIHKGTSFSFHCK